MPTKTEKKPKIWHVQFKYGDTHSYASHQDLIRWVHSTIDTLMPFARKFNKDGVVVLDDVKKQVAGIADSFLYGGERELIINEQFDPHGNGRVMLRIWKDV